MPKLTKKRIDLTLLPDKGQTFLRDEDLPGFALRLTPGSRTFILERRIKGRVRRLTIGPYGPLTLEQARKRAEEMIGQIAAGGDPATERSAQRGEPTFEDLEERYLREYIPRKKSGKDDINMLNRHLKKFRTWKLSAITLDEVIQLHTQIGKTASYTANRTVALLRKMFNLARKWKMFTGENPAVGVELFKEQSRDRFLQPDELKRLLKALSAEPDPYVSGALMLSLLTGARIGEVRKAQWSDIDFEQRVWHLPDTKAGRPHLLPLPGAAVQVLKTLPRSSGNPFVFVGRHRDGHIGNIQTAWLRIKEKAEIPDVRIHDLRRTLGSWLAGAGESLPMIGRILNHSTPSVTQVYARLALDPVRAALERNADRMLAIAGGRE